MSLGEWADPEDVSWPLRRVIDRVDGRDLLECGHPLPGSQSADPDSSRHCPVCYADSQRDTGAEIRAHQEFLARFDRQTDRTDDQHRLASQG